MLYILPDNTKASELGLMPSASYKSEIDKPKATGGNLVASENTSKKLKHNTKKASMLRLFISLKEQGLSCFEAANHHHDYVLRTTVSDLQLDYGLYFSRKWERVPNAFGTTTDCMRYWLDADNRIKASALLGNEEAI